MVHETTLGRDDNIYFLRGQEMTGVSGLTGPFRYVRSLSHLTVARRARARFYDQAARLSP